MELSVKKLFIFFRDYIVQSYVILWHFVFIMCIRVYYVYVCVLWASICVNLCFEFFK